MGAPVFEARQHTSGLENRPIQCSSHDEPVARTRDGRAAMKIASHCLSPAASSRWEASPLRAAFDVARPRGARVDDAVSGGQPWPQFAEPRAASIATARPWARPHRGQGFERENLGGADVAGLPPGFTGRQSLDGSTFGACRVLTGPKSRGTHPARVRGCAAQIFPFETLSSIPIPESKTPPGPKSGGRR